MYESFYGTLATDQITNRKGQQNCSIFISISFLRGIFLFYLRRNIAHCVLDISIFLYISRDIYRDYCESKN